jgi:hypothetical protein
MAASCRARWALEQASGGDAAWRQLRAPGQELASADRPRRHVAFCGIHPMHLDQPLCQIHTHSCNLTHGIPLSKVQIDFRKNQSWHADAASSIEGSPFVFIRLDTQRHCAANCALEHTSRGAMPLRAVNSDG